MRYLHWTLGQWAAIYKGRAAVAGKGRLTLATRALLVTARVADALMSSAWKR
jgi:hypothetical protein